MGQRSVPGYHSLKRDTAAINGDTIKLLDNIVCEKSVSVDGAIKINGKTLTLDLNGYNLTILNPEGIGLQLTNRADVTVTGTGNLNIVSKFAALNLDASTFNSGENINVSLESSLNTGIGASYQSTVKITKGSITGVAGGIYTMGSNNSVTFGGPITVNGKSDWEAHGINLSGNYTGNIVRVSGEINIASGFGVGIYVENGGIVTVGSQQNPTSVTSIGSAGIWTRQGSTTSDITVNGDVTGNGRAINATGDADIKVFGDVRSTSTLASVFAVEGMANSGDTIVIAITGNVEGPNGIKYHGNKGSISVTGNVTATGSASDTVGVFASYGSVSVNGNVAAPNGIGAEAGENGEITIDGVLTGNTYVKGYYVIKTASDMETVTTKEGYYTYKKNSAVVWINDSEPTTAYLLTVQNGTGSGSYLPGTPVDITADTPAQGKVFDGWTTSNGGSFGDANSASTTFTMPSNAVTVTATYKDAPTATYLLTVVSGTGGGTYTAGTQVSITADTPAQVKVFDGWTTSNGGSFGDANSVSTTFTMPSNTVTVTATYKDAPVETYTLTVSGSYAETSGAGQYAPGTQVSINAGSRSNYSFTGWTTSSDGSFANAASASTTFIMPNGNVTVTANWTYYGGGSDSFYFVGSPTTPITTLPEKRPGQPVTVAATVTPTTEANGTANTVIPGNVITDAITKAQSDAKAQGKMKNGIAVEVDATMSKSVTSLAVTLTQNSLNSLVNAGVKSFKINGYPVKISFDNKALTEIQKQSSGNVTITIKPVQDLTTETKKLIGTRPVYDITVRYVKDGKTIAISEFNGGIATIYIFYRPGKNEAVGYLYGVYVDAKGSATRIDSSTYDTNEGVILIPTGHLLIHGVGYTEPSARFTDIGTHWGKESIDYVVGRGLISGTSENTFEPNTAMSRAVLVTALGRLTGTDVSSYKQSSFTDVTVDKYYAPYIEWAYVNGIIKGIGNSQFAPDRAVTREEIALIFANYEKVTGYKLPVTREETTYEDASTIGRLYRTAVTAMQQAGIMMGDQNNKFYPKASATRAEVSAMLHRYVKLTINSATAQGFVLNDEGRWFYYKDGKALTEEQTINGVKYYFYNSGALQTGWVKVGDKWNFYSGTRMLIGWWNIESNDGPKTYYFDTYGNMTAEKWLEIGSKWYYFNTDGSLAKSTTIDGYEVDENGARKMK